MKRNRRSLKLSRETVLSLTSTHALARVAGGLRSVKAGCATDVGGCNTEMANCSMNQSCPGHCITDGAGCHSLNTRCE